MTLGTIQRRWLLAGPMLLVAGLLAPLFGGIFFAPRMAANFGVFFYGAAIVVSFFSVSVALVGNWPPFRGRTLRDKVILLVGSSPLGLLALMALVVTLDLGG